MHEISLVESIIKIVMAELPEYNITKVEAITLKIGAMRQVARDALLFAFDILSKDTPLEGAELIIERIPVKGHCKACNQDFVMEDWINICPQCDGMDIGIISGKELQIVGFEGS